MKCSQLQAILHNQFSSSWVTEARHHLQLLTAVIKQPWILQKSKSSWRNVKTFLHMVFVSHDKCAHIGWAVRNNLFSELFLCTEIFSKRRKICALWRETGDEQLIEFNHFFSPMFVSSSVSTITKNDKFSWVESFFDSYCSNQSNKKILNTLLLHI